MLFRGLTILKSPKLIIEGGLCYGFAMVPTIHPPRARDVNRVHYENTAPFSDYSTSIPPEYLQQESEDSYDEGDYDYYVN